MTAPQVLYARSEHGSYPIRVVAPPRAGSRGTFEVLSLGGLPGARYTSAKHLLAALTGNPRHGYSFDQYFGRQDAHPSSVLPPGGSVLDLFAPDPSEAITVARPAVVTPRPVPVRIAASQAGLTVAGTELGIDLEFRGNEVRKLLFAGFGARILRSGYDPEEVLQEVYRGILARNRGKCPFDARKSSFGHYVHMVCECVLNNYHRRESRRREVEQVGMSAPIALRDDAGASGMVDAATVASHTVSASEYSAPDLGDGMGDAIRRLAAHVARKRADGNVIDALSVKIAEHLAAGMNRREIAMRMGVSQTRVTTAINSLREHVADWM